MVVLMGLAKVPDTASPLLILVGALSGLSAFACGEREPLPSGRPPLEYALECEAALGPLPRFSCADAIAVPVTKDGEPLSKGSFDPSDCDHPTAFGKACDPGFRVGRYPGLNADGSADEDVVFLTNCRDGGLGVIGHQFSTGKTCFLHINLETTGAYDTDIPRPGEPGYDDAWQWPNVVAYDECQHCHMASPFLHSPAVDQLQDPADPTEPLVPLTGLGPYSVVGEEFEPLYTTELSNSCTSCHRAQCTQHFENFPLDALQMPPPFSSATDFDHSAASAADRQAVREWCASLDLQDNIGEE